MEYIIEMNAAHQLTIPEAFVNTLELGPRAYFSARLDRGRLVIESLPFSSLEQAKSLEKTVESLQQQ
ncbi:MAG TPA: hypothetical protein VIM29_10265 [Bacillota bacterium]